MKTAEQLSRVNDSDIYFAVAIILMAFNKLEFAALALTIGLVCFIAKELVRKIEGGK